MHTMLVREKAVKNPKIKGQVYKHVQDLGNVKIEFEKGIFYQVRKTLTTCDKSDIDMFHEVDSAQHKEFFLYKSRGVIFASFKESLVLVQYLQTIKIRLTFKY